MVRSAMMRDQNEDIDRLPSVLMPISGQTEGCRQLLICLLMADACVRRALSQKL